MIRYVVAVSQKEADGLWEYGWDTKAEAESHLQRVKSPPTDPFYAAMYHIYRVEEPKP